MDKRIYICAAIFLLLALVAYVLYSNLEIYKRTVFTSPSRDAITYAYYAMEKWLKETGHPVRFEMNFNPEKITGVEERVVMIHSSASRWDNAEKFILPWIEQGGYLVISIEEYRGYSLVDENLLKLLSGLGITLGESASRENTPREQRLSRDEFLPYLGMNVHFLFDNRKDAFTIEDNNGNIRLLEIPVKKGALTVTSIPLFMFNSGLREDVNAELAWKLTGARADGNNTGVLFVRERKLPKNILGKIMERGNLLPVVISAFLLIVLGFWMAIPVFGLTAVEKQRTSRPIRERFLAEIRFLKKYRTLDHYLDVYEREQSPLNVSENKKVYNYRELINQYRRMFDGTAKF